MARSDSRKKFAFVSLALGGLLPAGIAAGKRCVDRLQMGSIAASATAASPVAAGRLEVR